jgi:hypothetical protein
MKYREEKQEKLLKELTETNKMLLRLLGHLERIGPSMNNMGPPSETTSVNGDLPIYVDPTSNQDNSRMRWTNQDFPLDMSNGSGMYFDENDQHRNSELPTVPLLEAYEKMMANPKVAEAIAAQLNQAINARQGVEKEPGNNDDSMYEQVLDSETMAQLINQMLPPLDLEPPPIPVMPLTPGMEAHHHHHHHHHHHQMPVYEFSEASNGPLSLAHTASTPAAPTSRRSRRSPPQQHHLPHNSFGSDPHQGIPLIESAAPKHVSSPLTPISPSHPNPHPNIQIRTISSSSLALSSSDHLPQRNSFGKSRHGDTGDAPTSKRRRDK